MIKLKYSDAAIILNKQFIKNITANELSEIRQGNSLEYEVNIKGNLFCPECKRATLVHCDGDIINPYFKTHPTSVHDNSCSHSFELLSEKKTVEWYNENLNNININKRLHKIIGLLFKGHKYENNPLTLEVEKKKVGTNNSRQISHRTKSFSLPRRLLSQISNKDIDSPKIFYGKVYIYWKHIESDNTKRHHFFIYDRVEGNNYKHLLCRVSITDRVYKYIPQEAKKNQRCCIAFLSKMDLNAYNNKEYFNTYIISSNYLAIEPV